MNGPRWLRIPALAASSGRVSGVSGSSAPMRGDAVPEAVADGGDLAQDAATRSSSALRYAHIGLAGGLDRDGSDAANLLASGFGSVEFGTVTPRPVAGDNPGVVALVRRLARLDARWASGALIGIGIGNHADCDATLGGDNPSERSSLASEWLAGFTIAAAHADYLSFNLSARARRSLLAPSKLGTLIDALSAVAAARVRLAMSGKAPGLLLKLPLGSADLPPAAMPAVAAGFDGVIAVLPDAPERYERLARLVDRLGPNAVVIAVGGLRTAADVAAAVAAGASGVQVHRAYAEQGRACLPGLQAGFGRG